MSIISRFDIGPYSVGADSPPFIISEAGINHCGDLDRAFEMVEVAKKADVSAIKFQTFKAEEFVSSPEATYTYTSQGKEITEPQLEMFKRHEFTYEQWQSLREHCLKTDIMFLSTPQNRSDLDMLLPLGLQAIKVGSDDFTNLPQLRDFASAGLPMIVSCGMADLSDVHNALEALGTFEGTPTVLLLCTSQYPTPPEEVNLSRLSTLKAAFPGLPIGFSDHTQGPLASSIASSMGASVFEKHFTLSHDLPGPDHWFSDNPEELKGWVDGILRARTIMGSPVVRASAKELAMRSICRRSIVALRDIAQGERLTPSNTGLRRPGDGLPPALLDQVLDCVAARPIAAGSLIGLADFSA
ncbi:N-acetylneuraminate synthase family protein [Thalassospiraceae bacterium LMO-JJ14]|nr:N-acetylneuraminate synthase family protein [Thalassospiraceae bacterium LMO-JJ14]